MKQFITLTVLLAAFITVQAQQSYIKKGKLAPNVPTKTLKKLLESNFKRGSHRNVILISDTLLKRNSADVATRQKRTQSEIKLKRDAAAIADIKKLVKNKDSAATVIASIPLSFDFYKTGRSGEPYFNAAMAYAPKNGLTYLYAAAEYADLKKTEKAIPLAEKGWNLLNEDYKNSMRPLFALINFETGKKELAYKLLENEIEEGNVSTAVVKNYFEFYKKDKKLEEGIKKATEYINKIQDNVPFYSERASMYFEAGQKDLACADAKTLREKTESDDWSLSFDCPDVMIDATPTLERTYVYKVNFQNRDYDFRVTNANVDMDKGVSFKFKMTGENNITGKVVISKEAIATAHDQNNTFAYENLDLTDKTSVWVSKEVYNELKTDGVSMMGADPWGAKEYKVVESDDVYDKYYPVKNDGVTYYIKCLKVVSEDGQEIWIADNPKNPMILKMDVSFTIELEEII